MPPPLRFDMGDQVCAFCGAKPALYGFDGRLIEGRAPIWSCDEHREEVREMADIRKAQRLQTKVDAQVQEARAQKAAAPAKRGGPDHRQSRLFG